MAPAYAAVPSLRHGARGRLRRAARSDCHPCRPRRRSPPPQACCPLAPTGSAFAASRPRDALARLPVRGPQGHDDAQGSVTLSGGRPARPEVHHDAPARRARHVQRPERIHQQTPRNGAVNGSQAARRRRAVIHRAHPRPRRLHYDPDRVALTSRRPTGHRSPRPRLCGPESAWGRARACSPPCRRPAGQASPVGESSVRQSGPSPRCRRLAATRLTALLAGAASRRPPRRKRRPPAAIHWKDAARKVSVGRRLSPRSRPPHSR